MLIFYLMVVHFVQTSLIHKTVRIFFKLVYKSTLFNASLGQDRFYF